MVRRLLLLVPLVASTACGDEERPPLLQERGFPADGGGGDAAPERDAGLDDPTSLFRLVAPLAGRSAPVPSTLFTLFDGALVSLTGQKWALADGRLSAVSFTSSRSADHTDGATCLLGSRLYVFAGGGNGIFGAWHQFEWSVVDLVAGTWIVAGTATWAAHYLSAVPHGAECVTLGGDANPHGDVGSVLVRRVDPRTGTWSAYRSMSVPRSHFGAAVSGDTLVVAGGDCSGALCPGASSAPTPLDAAESLSLTGPAEAWTSVPRLPRALSRHGMVAHKARYYVAGGTSDAQSPFTFRREVLSWASGETAWRTEGLLPSQATLVALLSDGAALYLVGQVGTTLALYRASL